MSAASRAACSRPRCRSAPALARWLAQLIPAAPPGAVVLLGMVAYFSGVVQAPITAAIIVMEMTDNQRLTVPLLAALVPGVRVLAAGVPAADLWRARAPLPGRTAADGAVAARPSRQLRLAECGPMRHVSIADRRSDRWTPTDWPPCARPTQPTSRTPSATLCSRKPDASGSAPRPSASCRIPDVATLLGAPYRPDARTSGFRRVWTSRWSACRWISPSPTAPAAASGRARSATSSASARSTTRCGLAPMAELRAADMGDVPFRSRFDLQQSLEDIEAFSQPHPCGRGQAAVGRRRPFHQLPDPDARSAATGRSAWCISTRIATPAACTKAAASTTAARSAGGAGRRAGPGADHPDRHPRRRRVSVGVLLRDRDDGDPRRGGGRDGHRGGDRPGPRGGRRPAVLCQLRRGRDRPRLHPRHRHAGSRRADPARGAAHPARPRRPAT